MLNKKEFYSLLIIVLILFLYFIPAYTGIYTLFNDDCMQQSFPRLVAVARHVQKGEIPLWDNNSFTGAKGFYNVYESPIYNFILYPFYLLADTDNLDQCFIVLYLIPFNLFMILSAFACFFIGRKVIGLNLFASSAIGIIYALSPAFSISFDSLLNSSAHTFMAFMILGFAKFIEKQNIKWWLLTILFTVLMNLTFQFNYTIRIYFISGLISLFLIIFSGYDMKGKINITLKVLSIYLFGFFLCMFLWSGIFEGVLLIKDVFLNDQNNADLNSMHPLTLFTLLIPNFFGVNNGVNALGRNIDNIWNADTLSGGIFAFICLISCIYFKKEKSNIYKWSLLSIILLTISLISMLGNYSLIFKLFGLILPFIYKIPHPVYFNSLQGFSMALCIGIGLNQIMNNEKFKNFLFKTSHIIYSVLILILLVFIFSFIAYIFGNEKITFFSIFLILFKTKWFFSDPGIYFIISIILLILIIFIKNKPYFKYFFSLIVILEGIYIGQQVLYERNELLLPEENNNYRNMILGNYHLPKDSPMYQIAEQLKSKINNNYRFTSSNTELDNLSWVLNCKSLMAYDAKPIAMDMVDIASSYLKGFPYEMWTIKYPINFLKNLSVSHFIAHDGIIEDENIFENSDDEEFYYFQNDEEIIEKFENDELDYNDIFKSPQIKIYDIKEPMPLVYTQDKILILDKDKQHEKLLFDNMKDFACVYPDDTLIIEKIKSKPPDELTEDFNDIINRNKIISTDFTKANKISIKADIKVPSLMVINEIYHPGWKLKIDGNRENLSKVNFMLQGFWVDEGYHEIELTFSPKSLMLGLIISLISTIALIAVIMYYLIKKIEIHFK
ncbi:MAG: YfhO family protein [Spirochaetes bacterium]|nr:YfhO family protein [Spirochaetota bacterium]